MALERSGRRGRSGTIGPMTVPTRIEAAALLLSLDPPPWFLAHARAVGEVAGWLAARVEARGIAVDRRAVEAAHDPARTLPHDHSSAAWLACADHPELARS